MRALARLLRPLRHLLPLAWRTEIKTSIRDRGTSRRGLNRLLGWFVSPVETPDYKTEDELEDVEQRTNAPHPSPLLTVVVPFYNQPDYLMEALESVWRQTFADFEVIVVNDGSTDPAALALLETIDEPRTRVLHRENGGLPAARNTGLREAHGRWFVCLDSDDALRPTHFEKLIRAAEARMADLVHCDLERFDQGEGMHVFEGFHASALLRGNAVGNTACGLVRLDAWEAVGGYREDLRGYQDWQFWLDLCAAGRQAAHLPEPLFLYRRHGTSMISGSVKRHRELEAKILERHPDLAADPAKADAIETARRRLVANKPFLNLEPHRFRVDDEKRRVLFLADEVDTERRRRLLQALRDRADWETTVLCTAASELAGALVSALERPGFHLFHARPMMPREHAAALPEHMIASSRPDVLIRTGVGIGTEHPPHVTTIDLAEGMSLADLLGAIEAAPRR